MTNIYYAILGTVGGIGLTFINMKHLAPYTFSSLESLTEIFPQALDKLFYASGNSYFFINILCMVASILISVSIIIHLLSLLSEVTPEDLTLRLILCLWIFMLIINILVAYTMCYLQL